MAANKLDAAQVMGALEELREQLNQLNQRVAALEQEKVQPIRTDASAEAGLSEETVLAISASIAAYLGKRPHIRQIRLLDGGTWAQHGRATVQASHLLDLRRG